MKIYIAGKVTGLPVKEVQTKFKTAQLEIEEQGFEAVNPIEVVSDPLCNWYDAMKMCLKAMIECDAVVLLPDWWESTGAKIECNLAHDMGMKTFLGTKNLEKKLNINPA